MAAPASDARPISEPSAACAVVAIDMGYGHLRPARSIAKQLGTTVMHADRPPLADEEEQRRWRATRRVYEMMTRVSSLKVVGTPLRILLNSITDIPQLHPFRDLSSPTLGVMLLEHSARTGLGRSLVSYLQERNLALVTTFYSPASFADFHGYDRIFCVVTDSDINRVWAPLNPKASKIHYLAPSGRAVRRLRAYGVAPTQIELTGFPLPHALVGGPEAPILVRNLMRRLARLDPKGVFRRQFARDLEPLGPVPDVTEPPRLAFAVGGTGAQAELPGQFLPSLKPLLQGGRLRLTLVAGVRDEVRARFEHELVRTGLSGELGKSVDILYERELDVYFDRFDELLAETDVLWSKPSELVFYAGLGIPLLLAPAVGIHESYNLRFVRENGAGLKQRDPRVVGDRIREHLSDGNLAAAAWAGYRRLPNRGLYRIVDRLEGRDQVTSGRAPLAQKRLGLLSVWWRRYSDRVSLFRVNLVAKNPQDESKCTQPIDVLVDTGSELSWLPAEQLALVGIQPRRKRTFKTATGEPVERDVGYAVLSSEGYETIDEVVLGEKGDLCLLGVRTIEGFGVMIDALGHRFVAVSTVAAGSQHETG